ncbi:TPA: ATP-dependent endonuclease [Vibrio vulnificus]
MESINLKLKNIKNIDSADLEFPLEKGIYGIVGSNGCGKSTVLLALAQLTSKYRLGGILQKEDYSNSSEVEFEYKGQVDIWTPNTNGTWKCSSGTKALQFNGMYEGSLFYGSRFDDSRKIDEHLANGKINDKDVVDSDEYVINKMSMILHGNYDRYKKLKRIRNRHVANQLGFKNAPYLNEVNGTLISQYRMSSGECLLVSLLHFLYNSIVRSSLPKDQKILLLIDEIELALHPLAVSRLLDLLNELIRENDNLVVILTSHSPEVIRKLKPTNLLKINYENGKVSLESNCYPSYLIRDVYTHDGFDFLLLTEDVLARAIVEKILLNECLKESKLVHIVPAGGWKNVLLLQKELLMGNVLGINKQIISILDGDIKDDVGEEYKDIRKLFLPVKSIEKYIYEVVVENKKPNVRKVLNDKYFTIKSLDTLISEFNERFPKTPKSPDKKFYFKLKKDLENRGISEDVFINNLVDDLLKNVDFSVFTNQIKKFLCS